MNLPPPAPRHHKHTRSISCEGYQREDGLWDIEARIVDTKTWEIVATLYPHFHRKPR